MKFANSGKCIFVEGYDKEILTCFAHILGYSTFDDIPIIPIGGKSQWKKVLGAVEITGNKTGHAISNYCILDKDYYSDEKNKNLSQEATKNNIDLTIWNSKEIENYLINPSVIFRLIEENKKGIISEQDVEKIICDILEENKQSIINHFGSEIQKDDKSLEFSTVYDKASEIVNRYWNSLENKILICSGKDILKQIRTKLQETHKVSFSNIKLANCFHKNEIHEDIINFFDNLYR